MKRIKVLIFLIISVISISLLSITTHAATFRSDIVTEVSNYVSQGKLPAFHNEISNDSGYQNFYTKMVRTESNKNEALAYLSTHSRGEILNIISNYQNEANEIWENILTNLDIEAQYLDPNKILGIYWDSRIQRDWCYLDLIWTSEYIPSEFMTITDLTINGKKYKQYDNLTDTYQDANWFDTDYYHFPDTNLTIHKTPICGYEKDVLFGVPLMQKYKVTSLNAGIDKKQYFNDPDPKGIYNLSITSEIEFDLGRVPKKDGVKLCQLVSHAYEIIKDCEVQSYFDIAFGGYIHKVHFNTSIDIDRIYRVDVAYTLSSENKSWYQFWLETKEREVVKSLTTKRVSQGLFGLFKYQGFKEGSFQSNQKNSKYYKYELHLNYNDDAWNFFNGKSFQEADYKIIKKFKIFRMNFLADETVYDVAIKMDTVDGDTLSIVDRNLILDTDSTLWNVKDKVYDLVDRAEELFGKAGKAVLIIGSIIIFIIICYIFYKIATLVISILQLKEARKNAKIKKT